MCYDPNMLEKVLATIDGRREQSLSLLKEFLAIPSVSTDPKYKPMMLRCATWIADLLRFAGLSVQIMPTTGHPVVVAQNRHQPGRPTVLFYGHYDVQPPDPLELWKSPPFEPAVRKDDHGHEAIFARGAVDDKGQVWCHIEALLAWQAHGGPPINLTLLIEGEEEIGSQNLAAFVEQHKDLLRADICLVSDTTQFARGVPAITYGLRGLVYEEIELTGPSHDLHSGGYGGAVPNPANILCQVLATLHDARGRVTIPGFYDDVEPLTDHEIAMWARLPFDESHYLHELGLTALAGEEGYTALERTWARPTLDINGLTAGYQGPGAKTVIGSKASAKVSMRLVPNQDPHKIQAAFRKAIQDRVPGNVTLKFILEGGHQAAPVVTPIDNRATQLAGEALEIGFGKAPAFIRSGGTIPVVGMLKRELGVDSLLVGFGLPDDRVHSPNEKFDLDALYRGTRTAAALYERLGGLG
jgi:acetylornithine deacetylase/succinyl-diaminopimelate desuccinylase-like protein